jgi:hypothetical protein
VARKRSRGKPAEGLKFFISAPAFFKICANISSALFSGMSSGAEALQAGLFG